MTNHQRESVARYLYDASKIVLATAVVANVVAVEHFNVVGFFIGVWTMVGCFRLAYALEGEGG